MKTIWVITRAENEYDQFGEYFETAFNNKPTKTQIEDFFGTKNESIINHILNGGGRRHYEYTWYYLTEIKEGEQYISKNN